MTGVLRKSECGRSMDDPAQNAAHALGVCYYPEHWPEENWADDARRMAKLGLSWVRIGEFA